MQARTPNPLATLRMRLKAARALHQRDPAKTEPELRLLPALVDRRRVAVDVGANKGVYTILLAKLARRVHAYEPNPTVYPVLAAGAPSHVICSPIALSDRNGSADLSIPTSKRGPSSQTGSLEAVEPGPGRTLTVVTVETRRLDDEGLDDIGFLKIDVEGHESAVLRGAVATIERDRPILLVEIEQRHVAEPITDIFARVEDMGYAGFFTQWGALHPLSRMPAVNSWDEVTAGRLDRYVNNFLFLPRS